MKATQRLLDPKGGGKRYRQYLAAFFANVSGMAMGMCFSWTSSALPLLLDGKYSVLRVSPAEGSWIGSWLTIGGLGGALIGGVLIDSFGPKRATQLTAFPLFVSWILIAYCGTLFGIYAARFTAGIACGAISVTTNTYVVDIAEVRIKGTLGSFFQLQLTIGFLLSNLLGGCIEDFVTLSLVPALLPVIYLMSLSFMPESPHYLCMTGELKQARNSLEWLRGPDYDIDAEIDTIQDNILLNSADNVRITDLITCKATAKAFFISLGLVFFQQLSGVNAVIFYAGYIFQASGSDWPPSSSAVVLESFQVLATYASTLVIDRAGRRVLLQLSAFAMSLCLVTLGLYFEFGQLTTSVLLHLGIVPLLSLTTYIVAFSIGFGSVPWIIMCEIFKPKARSMAMAVATSFCWLLSFPVTKLFQNMLDYVGFGNTFFLFAGVCFVGFIFSRYCVPETKDMPHSEVMALMAS